MLDKTYWQKQLPHPYSPSDGDVEIYKCNLITGKTLLLGCTHKLINLSDCQMDKDPWYVSPTVITQDWTLNTDFYTNIIGDGVLNFTKDLCDNVIKMCSKYSKVFIARSFSKKLENMKIANYFPSEKDLLIKPNKIKPHRDYSFFIWNF